MSIVPKSLCVCAWRNRMPLFSCKVTEKCWFSVGKSPTNDESWVPICETLEYLREQSSMFPLHFAFAPDKRSVKRQARKRLSKCILNMTVRCNRKLGEEIVAHSEVEKVQNRPEGKASRTYDADDVNYIVAQLSCLVNGQDHALVG